MRKDRLSPKQEKLVAPQNTPLSNHKTSDSSDIHSFPSANMREVHGIVDKYQHYRSLTGQQKFIRLDPTDTKCTCTFLFLR